MTIFRGELQLLRWSETSTGGATVTFQLPDVSDLNGFKDLTLAKKGMAGQRIAAIMVAIEDGAEQTFAPVSPEKKPGQLCIMACTFCADPLFHEWSGMATDDAAKYFILSACRIDSRKKLDTDKEAGDRFHSHIRIPYMAWRAKA